MGKSLTKLLNELRALGIAVSGGNDGTSRSTGHGDNGGANRLKPGIVRRPRKAPNREGANHRG